jgi:hypothetical protein
LLAVAVVLPEVIHLLLEAVEEVAPMESRAQDLSTQEPVVVEAPRLQVVQVVRHGEVVRQVFLAQHSKVVTEDIMISLLAAVVAVATTAVVAVVPITVVNSPMEAAAAVAVQALFQLEQDVIQQPMQVMGISVLLM